MILAAITTHKRPPIMLERAIKSVINQTFKDWHLLIVDDSPQDYELRDEVKCMSEKWCAKDERITYIQHEKNYGVSHARNTALKFAENTYEGGGMTLLRTSMTMMNGYPINSLNK